MTRNDEFERCSGPGDCACATRDFRYAMGEHRSLMTGPGYCEVNTSQCAFCDKILIRVFYEHEAFTASQQWYLGFFPAAIAATVNAENILEKFAEIPWHFKGGSVFHGEVHIDQGAIRLFP